MANINELSAVSATEVAAGDLIVIFSTSNGDSRKMSLTQFLSWLNSNFARQDYVTTISTPANGFTETVTDDGLSRWILLRPTGSLATGTIVLPAPANATDGQEILITSTQAITALTINGNGATDVIGEPTGLTAGDKFTLRYNSTTDTWYTVA